MLYSDSAVASEGAGLGMGLLLAGTGSDKAAELLQYAHETQHEKIIRGLAMGLALTVASAPPSPRARGVASHRRPSQLLP